METDTELLRGEDIMVTSFKKYKFKLDKVLKHSRDRLNDDFMSFNDLYDALDEIKDAAKAIEKDI